LIEFMFVALFGAVGAVCRHGANLLAFRLFGPLFPLGTLAVNVVGCFLLGMLAHFGHRLDPIYRTALSAGFLGSLTTFSTFSYETVRFLEEGRFGLAGLNLAANLGMGLAAAWFGLELARSIWVET